jgi:hypothetical protein
MRAAGAEVKMPVRRKRLAPNLQPLDVIALLPVEQVVRVDAGAVRLVWQRHRDGLRAGVSRSCLCASNYPAALASDGFVRRGLEIR